MRARDGTKCPACGVVRLATGVGRAAAGQLFLLVRAPTAIHADFRALGQKGRAGRPRQALGKAGAIDKVDVAVELGADRLPDPPWWMHHLIFLAAPVALRCVAPVVVGDEFRFGTLLRQSSAADGPNLETVPATAELPEVRRPSGSAVAFALRGQLMAHRHRGVGLVVAPARDYGDGAAGHQLADKNDGAPPALVLSAAAH